MFARQAWPGWDAWGNEVGKFEAAETPRERQLRERGGIQEEMMDCYQFGKSAP